MIRTPPDQCVVQTRSGTEEQPGAGAIESHENASVPKVDLRVREHALPKQHIHETYDPGAPGEMGRPFITPANLSEADKKLVSEGWEKYSFNKYACDRISVRRTLPDLRDPW